MFGGKEGVHLMRTSEVYLIDFQATLVQYYNSACTYLSSWSTGTKLCKNHKSFFEGLGGNSSDRFHPPEQKFPSIVLFMHIG
jgi:hypothetical protein